MTSKKDNDDYMPAWVKNLKSRRIKLKATADELHGAWAERKLKFYQAEKQGKGKGKEIQSEVDKLHAQWQETNKEMEAIDKEMINVKMMMYRRQLKQEMGGNGTAGGTASGSDDDSTPGGDDDDDCTPGGDDDDDCTPGDGVIIAGGDDDDEKETTGGDDTDEKKVFYIYIYAHLHV